MTKSIAIAVVCCLSTLVGVDQTAFAQAGSTGGTIGKTDKAASGGNERTEALAKGAQGRARSGSAITGLWHWSSTCLGGFEGTFEIDGIDGGHFTGTIVNGNKSVSQIVGQVSSNAISFDNSTGEKWSGMINGEHMRGWSP